MKRTRRKSRLLLDADGVLLDFVGGFLKAVREAGGPVLSPEDFPEWDVFETLKENLAKTHSPEDTRRIMKEVNAAVVRRGFCLELEPLPGAVEAVKAIQAAEHLELFVITSHFGSNETWVHERDSSLKKHFGIAGKQILHGSSKHIVSGDIFVDDKVDNVTSWMDHNDGAAFLWDTPHNRGFQGVRIDGRSVRRLTSWGELLDILRIS